MSKYATTYGGAVYLSFGDKMITLTAADIKSPRFSYKAESFFTAISLGSIQNAITSLIDKFNDTTGLPSPDNITEQIKSATESIPPLKFLISSSDIVVTEFTVQPETETDKNDGYYAFGFGIRSKNNEGQFGPITLNGIAFSVQLRQTSGDS